MKSASAPVVPQRSAPVSVDEQGADQQAGVGWWMAAGVAAGAGFAASLFAVSAGQTALALFAALATVLSGAACARQGAAASGHAWARFRDHGAQLNAVNAAAWREMAHLDAVTGLANRRSAAAQLERCGPSGGALVLLRVADLDGLNRRLGRDATDRLLATAGELLAGHPQRIQGAWAARLDGSDFVLWLPREEPAADTCAALLSALQSTWRALASGVEAHGAVLPWPAGRMETEPLLEQAEELLAQAELGAPFSWVASTGQVHSRGQDAAVDTSASYLRAVRLDAAKLGHLLQTRQVALKPYPVCDAQGLLLYWHCPMHLHAEAEAATWPAQLWLPLAATKGLTREADLLALQLALQLCEADGQGRAVHVADESLGQPGFAEAVVSLLQTAQRSAARHIWLRVGEAGALRRPARLIAAAQLWRRAGARIVLEHAAGALVHPHVLPEVDGVSLDARFVRGLSTDPALRALLHSLVAAVRWQRLPLFAEGVDDVEDLAALWAAGVSGATGPAVTRAFVPAAAPAANVSRLMKP